MLICFLFFIDNRNKINSISLVCLVGCWFVDGFVCVLKYCVSGSELFWLLYLFWCCWEIMILCCFVSFA